MGWGLPAAIGAFFASQQKKELSVLLVKEDCK